jgi:hypothetical protein
VFDATNADSAISNNTATLDTYYHFTDCKFLVGATTNSAILTGNSTEPVSYLLNNCVFTVASGFTGDILQGPGMHVTNCVFDASAVTSGAYYHVDAESSNANGVYIGTFIGNKFYDGGSSGFVFKITGVTTGCNFCEDNNVFIGFTEPILVSEPGHIYDVSTSASHFDAKFVLGSRKGKVLRFTDDADEINPQAQVMAELLVITCTDTDNTPIISLENEMLSGQEFTIIAVNGDTDTSLITFSTVHQTIGIAGVPSEGKTICNFISYTFAAGDEEFMMSTGATTDLVANPDV